MIKTLTLLALVSSAASSGANAATLPVPKTADISYEVVWGMLSVDAEQHWKQDGTHYTLVTELKLPLGLKNRRYTSRGQVTEHGLALSSYEDQPVGAEQINNQAVVDRQAGELRYGPPDKLRTLRLEAGLQDLNALAFQLGWWGLPAAGATLPITNGKGVVSYKFGPAVPDTLRFNGKTYEAQHYTGVSREGGIEVWTVPELGGLPLQVVRSMDGRKLKFITKRFSTTP